MNLPGLTEVAVGDQSEEIEETKKMLYDYICYEKPIILAVTPANEFIYL